MANRRRTDEEKLATLDRRMAYSNEYNKVTYRTFIYRVNRKTEMDVIEHLESLIANGVSVNEYIGNLIKTDMGREV